MKHLSPYDASIIDNHTLHIYWSFVHAAPHAVHHIRAVTRFAGLHMARVSHLRTFSQIAFEGGLELSMTTMRISRCIDCLHLHIHDHTPSGTSHRGFEYSGDPRYVASHHWIWKKIIHEGMCMR
jgi:hypothetical protein